MLITNPWYEIKKKNYFSQHFVKHKKKGQGHSTYPGLLTSEIFSFIQIVYAMVV